MKKFSIVIIEDNRLLRESIVKILAKLDDLRVKASFEDSNGALPGIIQLKPHIVLIDLDIHSQNSLQFVKRLKKDLPEAKVIVMDIVPLVESVLLFIKAGVWGFILKDAKTPDILRTIRSVANGEKVLPTNLTESLFSQIVAQGISDSTPPVRIDGIKMTKREHQMMELVSQGFANKEIADKLNLSIFTVKSHIHNILEKLAFNTRVQIANYAHTSGNYKNADNETTE